MIIDKVEAKGVHILNDNGEVVILIEVLHGIPVISMRHNASELIISVNEKTGGEIKCYEGGMMKFMINKTGGVFYNDLGEIEAQLEKTTNMER